VAASLSEHEIARELASYQVELSPAALHQLSCYLELLLRWNQRINLTGYRDPHQIVRRLFGESLFLAQVIELRGWLVDVGSGAGFPGLALKLAAPDLRATLIESRRKKGAFMKEVARSCEFYNVDVVVERFESWARRPVGPGKPSIVTTRAVKPGRELLDLTRALLADQGKADRRQAQFAHRVQQIDEEQPLRPDFAQGLGAALSDRQHDKAGAHNKYPNAHLGGHGQRESGLVP